MIEQIVNNPLEWRHLSFEEYVQYISLFDTCPCKHPYLGLYTKQNGTEFVVMCNSCCSFVMSDKYINALTTWNKKCRLKAGLKN